MTDELFAKRRSRPTLPDRVRDSLFRDLFSDVYVVGDQLPNEDVLAARFEVSRATIREAVRGLVEAGYLVPSSWNRDLCKRNISSAPHLERKHQLHGDDPPGGPEAR